MSRVSAKKNEEEDWMFPVNRIAAIFWKEEDAKNLKNLRTSKNLSLRELVEKTNEIGYKCSYTYIHKLETVQTHRTNPLLIIGLAKALEANVYEIIGSCLYTKKKKNTPTLDKP